MNHCELKTFCISSCDSSSIDDASNAFNRILLTYEDSLDAFSFRLIQATKTTYCNRHSMS